MPAPTPLAPGEPTGEADPLAPSIAVLPLRLSLTFAPFPVARALGVDGCSSSGDPAAGPVSLFPVARHTFLPLTQHLVLHGFSSGCAPVDSGVGGGLTYDVPVAKNWWLVGGLGAYGVQSLQAGQPAGLRARTDARLDVVYRPSPSRSWSFGVGRRGVAVGGSW